ncbi:MAG: peptidylprolyl isomerase [Acidimicrobiia bacterium]|nr:peptidylprolyl isomerase [Acidimicrobiia bacterium]
MLAATVDSHDYTVGDINALVFDDGATVSKEQFAQFLGFLIQWDIVVNAADADYGVTFTDEEIAESAQTIYLENAAEGTTFEEFLSANAVSEEFLNKVAHLQLVETGVRMALEEEIDPPSAEDLEAQRQSAYESLTEVCAAHILVDTESEAENILDRLADGEVFADLAIELSTDRGTGDNGGDLGCGPPSRYVEDFAKGTLDAEIDVPFGPVESEFGFHIILVNERTFPTDDELPTDDEITESLKVPAINQALTDWIGGHLAAAVVFVDEKYGTWQTEPAGVVPPA